MKNAVVYIVINITKALIMTLTAQLRLSPKRYKQPNVIATTSIAHAANNRAIILWVCIIFRFIAFVVYVQDVQKYAEKMK